MVFKSDKQRKFVMAKLKGQPRVSFQPTIIKVRREVKVPEVLTISDVRRINSESGRFFFESGSMRFFDSKIETSGVLINNRLFITSERFDEKSPRKFTVRGLNKKTGGIDTVGEFQQFKNKQSAVEFALTQR